MDGHIEQLLLRMLGSSHENQRTSLRSAQLVFAAALTRERFVSMLRDRQQQRRRQQSEDQADGNGPFAHLDAKTNTESSGAVLGTCLVCMEENQSLAAFVPCGHACVCGSCAKRIISSSDVQVRRCPSCRKEACNAAIVMVPETVSTDKGGKRRRKE